MSSSICDCSESVGPSVRVAPVSDCRLGTFRAMELKMHVANTRPKLAHLVSRMLRIGHIAWRVYVKNMKWCHIAAIAVLEAQARYLQQRRLQRSAVRALQCARNAHHSQQTDVEARWRRRLLLQVSLPPSTSLPGFISTCK